MKKTTDTHLSNFDDTTVPLSEYLRLYERYSKLKCFIGQAVCFCPPELTMNGNHYDHCMLSPVEKALRRLEEEGKLNDYGFWDEDTNLGYFGMDLL